MYKKMYYTLFNAITRALEDMSNREYEEAERALKKAQQEAEEISIESGEEHQRNIQNLWDLPCQWKVPLAYASLPCDRL